VALLFDAQRKTFAQNKLLSIDFVVKTSLFSCSIAKSKQKGGASK
jgi:hypothetical protein